MDVGDLERQAGHAAVGGARLFDHRRVDVHADHATLVPDSLGDAAGDRAGAASDVEHREAGMQQRRQAAVPRPERAGVENRAGALRHVGPLAGDVRPTASGCPTGFSYHEPAGGVACRR